MTMSETKHVKLVLPADPDGGTASIEVDGAQISGQVRTVTVMAGVGQHTEVALELPLIEIEGQATVSMTAATRRLLLAYGWTPPGDGPQTPAPHRVLDLPLDENDAGADTIREYLLKLLEGVWRDGECFNEKRPFGNSGWHRDFDEALIKARMVQGTLDEDGWVKDVDRDAVYVLVLAAIQSLVGSQESTAGATS